MMLKYKLKFFVAVSLLVLSTTSNGGQNLIGIRASGTVESLSTRRGYSANVEVVISEDGRFFFKYDNHGNYPGSIVEFSFDGENYFQLISENKDGNNDMAFIIPAELVYPAAPDAIRNFLWLTLVRGRYFQEKGAEGEFVDPFAHPRRTLQAYGYRYEVDVVNNRFPTVRHLSTYRDQSFDSPSFEEAVNRPYLDLHVKNLASSWKYDWDFMKNEMMDGLKVKEIIWENEQKLGDLRLPIDFIIYFYPLTPHEEPYGMMRAHFAGWQKVDLKGFSFQPKVKGLTWVRDDARVRQRDAEMSVDSVSYYIGRSDDEMYWPEPEDEKVQTAFTRQIKERRALNSWFTMKRLLIPILVFVLVLPFLVLRFRK